MSTTQSPQHQDPMPVLTTAPDSTPWQTPRTLMRAYTPADEPLLLALCNDGAVQRNNHPGMHPTPRSAAFAREYVEKTLVRDGSFFAVVEDRATHARLGFAGLLLSGARNRDAHVGIALVEEWRGKGFGGEIVRWLVQYGLKELGLHRVSLSVIGSNVGAYDLYKRIGFVEEGRVRRAIWDQGEWVDLLYMGIIDEEWDVEKGERRNW
ncbi:acyl-CoA N-acyltransferase [Gloeopeniophorella convolvens]|nr:acyl-CoA N-acyltransferase [Gloeopeniophorella convolvens]